jgi:hypothetical protein
VIFWPAVVSGMQRRRWAAQLEKSAPPQVTVAAAADLLRLDRHRFLEFLRGRLGMTVVLSSEVSREALVDRLRTAAGPPP